MKITGREVMIAGAIFGTMIASNVVAQSIYTKSIIGIDKKRMLLAGIGGLLVTTCLIKLLKVKTSK